MSELNTGESFPKAPNKTLQEDQLFPAEILAQSVPGVTHAISVNDKTWVTIDPFAVRGRSGHYDAIGGDVEGVMKARDRLDNVFDMDVNYGWLVSKTMVQQLEGGELEKAVELTGEIHNLEKMLGSYGVRSLEAMTVDLSEEAIKRREEIYRQKVTYLNEKIEDDPSDIMFGLATGRKRMAAKLEGLYVDEVEADYSQQRVILPVLSGQDRELGRLSKAKTRKLGIYGVFVEATETGIEQIEETKRYHEEYFRSMAK